MVAKRPTDRLPTEVHQGLPCGESFTVDAPGLERNPLRSPGDSRNARFPAGLVAERDRIRDDRRGSSERLASQGRRNDRTEDRQRRARPDVESLELPVLDARRETARIQLLLGLVHPRALRFRPRKRKTARRAERGPDRLSQDASRRRLPGRLQRCPEAAGCARQKRTAPGRASGAG